VSDGGLYEVRSSADFLREAHALFPRESSEGRTIYRFFSDGPLAAAIEAFSRSFEEIPETPVGSGIRALVLPPSAHFSPLVFFGLRVSDESSTWVELISIIDDPGYWETIEGDPTE
jgi:hypothetical protein